jgi:hypothetical protein
MVPALHRFPRNEFLSLGDPLLHGFDTARNSALQLLVSHGKKFPYPKWEDDMKRIALRTAAVLGLILLASMWMDVRSTKADPQSNTFGSPCVSYVPQSWGEYKGGSYQTGLAFQDGKGTLRFVTNMPCDGTPLPVLEIRRSAATNNNN